MTPLGKLGWWLFGCVALLALVLYAILTWDKRAADAARVAAIANEAKAHGFARTSREALVASQIDNASLRAKVEALAREGGKVTTRWKILTGTGTVAVRCPLTEAPTSPGLASVPGDLPVPSVPVTVGPASVECGVVDDAWWACSDVDVLVTPPGTTVHLPLDPNKSRMQFSKPTLDLGGRVRLTPRGPRYWRAGWAVGPAGLVDPSGGVHVGIAVVWGAQF